ncbi:MAG: hypothetical protein KF883_05865 [Thermomicrobiales bacterium]|nr:hypothetical protein [Thermomicrobiales bacterium]
MTAETKQRTRRQVVEEARQAALDSRWDEAIEINRELIQRDAKDTEAHNRLGRALMEKHDYNASYEAYSNALKSDLANLIARRNLQRLEILRNARGEGVGSASTIFPRSSVFIEEVGKTWVTELTNPVPTSTLAGIYAGQQLVLSDADGRLVVSLLSGERVGEVERRTAERVIELMEGGNVYEAYALGLTAASLRVILREVHRDPSQIGRISFPRQIQETRAYLRERDLLRQRDESDFYVDDFEDLEADDDQPAKSSADGDEEEAGDGDEVVEAEVEGEIDAANDDEDPDAL